MNLLKVKTRKEHKNIFCDPSKLFKNISWFINICPKYFMILQKPSAPTPLPPSSLSPPPPTYLMYGPLSRCVAIMSMSLKNPENFQNNTRAGDQLKSNDEYIS